MRGLITAMLLGVAQPALAQINPLEGEAAQAAAVVDQFHAALHRGDASGAAVLLSDDALIYEEGHAEQSKAEYAAEHLAADAIFSRQVTSAVTKRRGGASGDIAWVATEGRTKGDYNGKPVNSFSTETVVLHRAGSFWKIAHIHWSSHKAND